MTNFNTIYYLILVIIGLCVPIYYLIGRQKFTWYLIILFGGSLIQKAETVYLLPIYPSVAMIIYDMLAIIISISLILFILREYINIEIIKEKRFVVFTVTAILGIGLRILESYTDIAIWTSMLAYYISIAILGIGFLMTQNLKQFIHRDGGLLLSIIAGAVIYIILYRFYQEKTFFYWTWLLVMGMQVATWLFIGLLQLKRGALANPQLKTHHITKSYSFLSPLQTYGTIYMSGTVDRW